MVPEAVEHDDVVSQPHVVVAPAVAVNTTDEGNFTGADKFGPANCISLAQTNQSTCELRTDCGTENLSSVDFSFVCFNPGSSLPHALHSFGRGGFYAQEVFDTEVVCERCATVADAFRAGGPLMQSAIGSIPGDSLTTDLSNLVGGEKPLRTEASYFGPSSCVSTFLSATGTCIIETQCTKSDLDKFNMGITCLDSVGKYARYRFGKHAFKAKERFDTRLECAVCLGLDDADKGLETSKLDGVVSEKLMDQFEKLKAEMRSLREELGALRKLSDSSAHFDCEADLGNWQKAWSANKIDWCCKNEAKGCEQQENSGGASADAAGGTSGSKDLVPGKHDASAPSSHRLSPAPSSEELAPAPKMVAAPSTARPRAPSPAPRLAMAPLPAPRLVPTPKKAAIDQAGSKRVSPDGGVLGELISIAAG
jgi:hypothetical protein